MSYLAAIYIAFFLLFLGLALLWARKRWNARMTNGKEDKGTDGTLYCSFCGKSQNEVAKLIAGPTVFICNECVDLCNDIVHEDHRTLSLRADAHKLTPGDLCAILGRYVKNYPRAKQILALAAYQHFQLRQKLAAGQEPAPGKANILLIGPAGCGKRLLAESAAQMLSAPYATASAAALVDPETGAETWKALFDDLLSAADYNVVMAQRGVIYLDACDNVCGKGDDPSDQNLQHALLDYIRGKALVVHFDKKTLRPGDTSWEFDTSDIQFILGGAFLGVEDHGGPIGEDDLSGFDKTIPVAKGRQIAETLRSVERNDLLAFGMSPDLLDQIPYVATLRDLRD